MAKNNQNLLSSVQLNKDIVEVKFKVLYFSESGSYSCYIPGFNMFFSIKDLEAIQRKAAAMVSTYLRDWFKMDRSSYCIMLLEKGMRITLERSRFFPEKHQEEYLNGQEQEVIFSKHLDDLINSQNGKH